MLLKAVFQGIHDVLAVHLSLAILRRAPPTLSACIPLQRCDVFLEACHIPLEQLHDIANLCRWVVAEPFPSHQPFQSFNQLRRSLETDSHTGGHLQKIGCLWLGVSRKLRSIIILIVKNRKWLLLLLSVLMMRMRGDCSSPERFGFADTVCCVREDCRPKYFHGAAKLVRTVRHGTLVIIGHGRKNTISEIAVKPALYFTAATLVLYVNNFYLASH